MPTEQLRIQTADEDTLRSIVSVLGCRGVRIESLNATRSQTSGMPGLDIHIATEPTDARSTEMLIKRINRLVNVVKTVSVTENEFHQRRAVVVKVKASRDDRGYVLELAGAFGAEILELREMSVTLALFAAPGRVDELLELLDGRKVLEVADSGRLAVRRGRSRRAPFGAVRSQPPAQARSWPVPTLPTLPTRTRSTLQESS